MGIFFKRKNTEIRSDELSGEDTLIRALLNPANVTKEMALQIPSIAGTIDLIGSIIASTPIKLYEAKGGKTEEVKNDNRVFLLNDDTGDTLTSNDFWKALVKDYYTGKGGYAYINRQKGKVKSLHYVDEAKIHILKNNDAIFKDFDISVDGKKYLPFQFIKILRNTKDGAKGIPITEENSALISVGYSALIMELNSSRRGGNKKGFLKSDKKIDELSIKALKEAFARLYSSDSTGTDNFVVLNSGIDFKESSNTMAEMQLNENKITNAEEMAKLFHVSTEAVSGKSVSTSTLAKLAAIPLMSAIQSALNKDLLKENEKISRYFAFDTKELLKGEMVERFNSYKTALEANFMKIDEVRYLEDLEPMGIDFIKLGLRDVLYDPKTKEVFTPNTGKTQNMNSLELSQSQENDIIQKRANPNHDPKTGKFTNSKTKGNVRFSDSRVLAEGANDFKVKGFKNNQKLNNHWEKHKKEYIPDGIKTKEDYLNKALNLVQSPCGNGIEGYKTNLGQICRYDTKTNYYVKGNPQKGIFTMFKPNDGKRYFDNMKKNESENKKWKKK